MRGTGATPLASLQTRALECAAVLGAVTSSFALIRPANAEEALRLRETAPDAPHWAAAHSPQTALVAGVSLMVLVLGFAGLLFVVRRNAMRRVRALDAAVARSAAELDRAKMMLRSDSQIVITWERPDSAPTVEGRLDSAAGAPLSGRVLDFASWLSPDAAAAVQEGKDRLLKNGAAFSVTATDRAARRLEIDGRAVSGAAVIRIRDASGDRLRLAEVRDRCAEAEDALASLRLALETAEQPAWMRDSEGRLIWSNAAYARAVEAVDGLAATDSGAELFDVAVRREAAKAIADSGVWKRRSSAVARGEKRTFDAVEVAAAHGSVGVARDVTEVSTLSAEMKRNEDNYSRTIDRIATAVAIFDKAKRLTFYNSAYRQIWSLEPAFLDQRPTDGEILDRLRARRLLPEQADFRTWKAQQMTAYQAIESSETVWYLPDGRALRVVTSSQPSRRRDLSL